MRGHIRQYKDRWAAVIYLGKDAKGKEQRKWLYNKNKKELEKQMNDYIYKVEHGIIQINSMKDMTFSEWFYYYKDMRKTLKDLSEDTVGDYESIYNNYLQPLYNKKLSKIEVFDIQSIYKDVIEKKGTKRAEKVHSVLSVFIVNAYKQRLIEHNLMDFVDAPTSEKYVPHVIEDDEYIELIKQIKDTYLECLTVVCSGLGLRIGEALGIQKKKCIDFENNILHVNQQLKRKKGGPPVIVQKLKNDSSKRDIAMPPDVTNYLLSYIEKQEKNIKIYEEYTGEPYHDNDLLICKDNGDPKPHTTVQRNWRELFPDNKAKFRIHDLRHFNAILMLRNNVPDKVARDRLGHKDVQMTDRYQHTTRSIDAENAIKIILPK